MKCVYCGCMDSKVIDSRLNADGTSIRRRRECGACGKRFTTYVTIQTAPIMFLKHSGSNQAVLPSKLKNGILKAGDKRPVSMQQIDKLVSDIEKKLANGLEQEVTSDYIGDLVMDGLKEIDDVAYVRFAAVHRQFKDINSWLGEINEILKNKNGNKDDGKK